MKSTGIVRRIDDLGRICLPKELRRTLKIKEGDPVEIFVDGDQVILKKYVDEEQCAVCHKYTDLMPFAGTKFCRPCLQRIYDAARIGS